MENPPGYFSERNRMELEKIRFVYFISVLVWIVYIEDLQNIRQL